uniref:Ig-like domain-containing protein n=1 Tax=Leptobrachium leishanense TaxID=445787 RepID=A0A8C5MDM9_9ANUR
VHWNPLSPPLVIVLNQTPVSLTASPGDTVSMYCKASESIYKNLAWYKQKPGEPPQLLIYAGDSRYTGTPERFNALRTGSGADFTLRIKGILTEDAAIYYCQFTGRNPLTQ